jgi:hypothetical protein
MKEKHDQTPLKSAFWRSLIGIRPLQWIMFAQIFTLLFFGHCFGYDKWQVPTGQPEQMWSKVDYDPKLSDPFFEADEWSCPDGSIKSVTCQDGKPALIHEIDHDSKPPESFFELKWSCPDGCQECSTCRNCEPVVKTTAKCYSTSFGVKHPVNYCEARLLDEHVIDLLFYKFTPAFRDSLRVSVKDGQFTCQYWILDSVGAFKWTTTRQELTLDKKAYRKGDVIKGRIDFECLRQLIDPNDIKIWRKDPTTTIKLFGVFKTTIQ